MRFTIDGTPLLGRRTGIGRYVERLVAALPAAVERRRVDAVVEVSTWTARGGRVTDLPEGVVQVGRTVSARLLRSVWSRWDVPPIEALVGRTDVFHGTNFVSPPTRHAREVLTVHDLTYALHRDTVSSADLAYRELVQRAVRRGAHLVCPSHAVAEAVRTHYGLGTDRVTVTPLGVDDGWFTTAPASAQMLAARSLPRDFLLFVGSLDPRKNLSTLLEAHTLARATDPDTPDLVLAGPAGREPSLAQRPGVHLTGWLEDSELRAVVAASSALVLPSLDEGFGLPVLEALACGRPVVVSRAPALLEVGGEVVVDAPADDAEALGDALRQALAQPDGPADRAARRVRARLFDWGTCADRTLDAYLGA